jgi:hypothetical protein
MPFLGVAGRLRAVGCLVRPTGAGADSVPMLNRQESKP